MIKAQAIIKQWADDSLSINVQKYYFVSAILSETSAIACRKQKFPAARASWFCSPHAPSCGLLDMAVTSGRRRTSAWGCTRSDHGASGLSSFVDLTQLIMVFLPFPGTRDNDRIHLLIWGRLTRVFLQRHIPLTPINYRIWSHYTMFNTTHKHDRHRPPYTYYWKRAYRTADMLDAYIRR
jgi:hypothetical protein